MFNLFRSRDKAVRYILTGLLGLVALSMVTYLIPTSGVDTQTTGDSSVVATVGGDDITSQQVAKVVTNLTKNRQLPAELLSIYVPQIVQQMISERALAYEANRLGMRVTSDETDNAILDTLPAELVKNGKVDAATLNAMLQQQGATIADLKNDTARQLLVGRLRVTVAEGAVVSPRDIENEFRKRNEKVKVEYALLEPAKYQAEAEPSDAEIKAYYEAHKATFKTQEKRSLGVIILDPEKINAGIHIPDAELQKDYTASLDKFRVPERVMARHILIKSDATNDAAMKAKAEGLLKQIQAGGDFAKLAKENSQDPGSSDKEGELGWLVRGQTVPEFEKSAFSMQPGQVSGLVKTTYGYHIIKTEQHQAARVMPFEEAKAQVLMERTQRTLVQLAQSLSDKAIAELRKDPQHPEKAAAAVDSPLTRVENLLAGDPIPGIGVSKEFSDAIASLKKGDVTAGPISLPGNKAAIAVVTDYQPVHAASLEEAAAEARNKARDEKVQKLLTQKAADLLAKAQAMGGDLQKAAKELKIEVKTSAEINRQGAIEGVGSVSSLPEAFTKAEGGLMGPVTVPGGRLVARVAAKIPADMAGLGTQSATLREEMKQQKARERSQLFEEGLKKRLEEQGKLKIKKDVLARLVQTYTTRS